MYEVFFGLSRRPFSASADADCYFPATAIETARQTLFRTIDRGEGAALLIGAPGAGKSLLLEVLAEQFRQRFSIALLNNGRLNTRRELLQAILYELELPYRDLEEGELRLALIDHLSDSGASSEGLLLLIDEAHTIPLKVLEEVRLITNLVRSGVPKVRLVLAGSPALEERFTSPKLDTFNQRITARCYLKAFDRAETRDYVKARLEWAGGKADSAFNQDALEAVYDATQGIPRLINQLCDHAMLASFAADRRSIGKSAIEEAWADLQQLPTPWGGQIANSGTTAGETIEFGVLDESGNDSVSPAAEESLDFISIADEDDQHAEAHGNSAEDVSMDITAEVVNHPAATPARSRTASIAVEFGRSDPLGQLAHVERQIAAINSDYGGESPLSSQVDISFGTTVDPFSETFAEEELVIDPFAMTATDALANRPLVQSDEGRKLGALLKPLPDSTPRKLALASSTADEETIGATEDLDLKPWPDGNDSSFSVRDSSPPIIPWPAVADDEETGFGGDYNGQPRSSYEEGENEATRAAGTDSGTTVTAGDPAEPELIVIEDESPSVPKVTVVRRGQYRQLFSNLRRG
jgi:type II secretory pathway predicted ATPase ExeA